MSKDKQNISKLLDDFDVKNEDELFAKLVNDSKTIPCIECGIEYEFEELVFPDGDPICKKCLKG